MKLYRVGLSVVLLSSVVLSGCKRGDNAPESVMNAADAPVASAWDLCQKELADLKSSAGRDAAIEHAKTKLADPAAMEIKVDLVSWVLDEYLQGGELGMAQDAYLALSAQDNEIARMGFQKISSASVSTNAATTTVWYEKVLAAPVEDGLKAYIWRSRISQYASDGSVAPVIDRMDEILGLKEAGIAMSVFSAISQAGLQLEDFASLQKLVAVVDAKYADDAECMSFARSVEADVLLNKGQLVELDAFLLSNAAALGDNALSGRSEKLLVTASAQNATAIVSRVVSSALAGGSTFPKTLSRVGLQWVKQALDSNNVVAFLDRSEQTLKAGLPVANLTPQIQRGFYVVMQSGNAATQGRVLTLIEGIRGRADLPGHLENTLDLLLLDGAFYTKNFKRAYDLLVKGISGYDDAWHVEMKDKVGAHLALQEGRFEDAISLFRLHMARVEKWDAPVVNPENNTQMIKEAVMGFNEKRIGDIYAGMDGRAADSQAAYARAREWYKKALVELKPDSLEYKAAAAELAAVPAAK